MNRCEYTFVTMSPRGVLLQVDGQTPEVTHIWDQANRLGNEGWEIDRLHSARRGVLVIFKRQKQQMSSQGI